jgi:hypothetical protein
MFTLLAQTDTESVAFLIGMLIGLLMLVGLPIFFIVCLILFIKTKNKGWLVGTILSGLVALVPIGLFVTGFVEGFQEGMREFSEGSGQSGSLDKETNTVTSADGLCSVRIPKSWSTMSDLNAEASLQVGNGFREEYMIILVDRDYEYDGTLREHSDLTTSFIVEGLIGPKDSGPEEIVLNGLNALQREIHGRISGLDISYLHTSIEGEKGFYQVLAWTLTDREPSKFPVYREVLESFQEL